jgi:hypothetical protein
LRYRRRPNARSVNGLQRSRLSNSESRGIVKSAAESNAHYAMHLGSNSRRITATRPDLVVACSVAAATQLYVHFATTLYYCRMRQSILGSIT